MSDRRRAMMTAAAESESLISLEAFLRRVEPDGEVVLPTIQNIPEYAFYMHNGITSVRAPNCTKIMVYAFASCQNLQSIYAPELTTIGRRSLGTDVSVVGYAFDFCRNLKNISFPKLKTVMCGRVFSYLGVNQNYNIVTGLDCGYIVLPSIETLGREAFRKTSAAVIDLGPGLTKIWNDTFYAGKYGAVILRSPTVVPAANQDSVREITTLYVPSDLVEGYKTASYWSAKASTRTVLPIEGSQYEHYYADGTPVQTTT